MKYDVVDTIYKIEMAHRVVRLMKRRLFKCSLTTVFYRLPTPVIIQKMFT